MECRMGGIVRGHLRGRMGQTHREIFFLDICSFVKARVSTRDVRVVSVFAVCQKYLSVVADV